MFDLVSHEDIFDGMSSACAKFGDSGLGKAWRGLKVSEQEVPKSVLALDEMPIRTARDEHQTVVVSPSSDDDVNMSRHSALPQARSKTLPPLQLPPARTSSFVGDSAPQQDRWKPSSLPLLPLQTALAGMYVVVMPDLLLAAMALAVVGDLFLHAARGPRLIGVHLRAPVGHGLWVYVGHGWYPPVATRRAIAPPKARRCVSRTKRRA